MGFEDIKKEFIVDSKEYTKERLAQLMKVLIEFVRVGGTGEVVISKRVPTRKILKLILTARYIAHEAEKSISAEVPKKELETYSGLKKAVFAARYNEMIREGFVEKKGDLVRVRNILLIDKFVNELKGGEKNE